MSPCCLQQQLSHYLEQILCHTNLVQDPQARTEHYDLLAEGCLNSWASSRTVFHNGTVSPPPLMTTSISIVSSVPNLI
jgi:hypothetical protein